MTPLPCPFCGAAPVVSERECEGHPYTSIRCEAETCLVQPMCVMDGAGCTDIAVAAWNTRHRQEKTQ